MVKGKVTSIGAAKRTKASGPKEDERQTIGMVKDMVDALSPKARVVLFDGLLETFCVTCGEADDEHAEGCEALTEEDEDEDDADGDADDDEGDDDEGDDEEDGGDVEN